MGRSSVFSLEQIYRKQITQTWSKIPEVFRYVNSVAPVAGPAFGYFAGGNPGPVSKVDRVDYSNDNATASAKGALPAVRYYMGSAGNRSYGWFAGGNSAGYPTNSLSTVYRLDYGSDSTSPTPKGNLSIIRAMHAGTGNENYGYFAAGDATTHSSNPVYSTIDRIDYANDTATSTPKGLLNEAKTMLGAAGNQSYGYFAGGASILSSIDRIDYGNDTTTASPKGNLGAGVRLVGGTSNPSYAYFGGGYGPSNYTTHIQRLDFANDTGAPLHTTLGTSGTYQNSATGSSSFGYWGGTEAGGGLYGTIIQRLDYSNDTGTAGTRGNLSSDASFGTAGVSARDYALPTVPTPATLPQGGYSPGGTNYGYFAGGGSGSPFLTSIQRLDFDNDTATTSPKGNLSRQRSAAGATGSNSYAYVARGRWNPPHMQSLVDRVDYSNDTATAPGHLSLPTTARWNNAVGNVNFGYVGASRMSSSGGNSIVERIDYSNDTASTPVGNLSASRYLTAVVGNQNYGYFCAGLTDSPSAPWQARSLVDRIDYGNDSPTASPKGNLTLAVHKVSAAGNLNYGYVAGGQMYGSPYSSYTTIQRINYADDTATASPKGNLPNTKYTHEATGNQSYGYFVGGLYGSLRSSIDRVDYANDTSTASPKGPLSANNNYCRGFSSKASGNPTGAPTLIDKGAEGYTTSSSGPAMGYVLGGAFPYSFSTVDRVDYANDTATAAVKGPLSAGTSYQAAVSSKDHGYSLGGKTPSEGKSSKVDRVDYANDTATAAVKGPLSAGYYRSYAGVGNKEYGYVIGGGYSGPWSTYVQRVEYASDTSTATTKGPMAGAVYLNAGTGNLSYGYSTGGSSQSGGASNESTVERLDYASDTSTMVVKGPLAQGARKMTATGTASYGYVGGGTNPTISMIQRIDYASDTSTAVAKGPLTSTRDSFASFSAPGHGYFTGGTPSSTVERMDYANDTATATAKGPLSLARGYDSGVSPQDIAGALN